MGRIVDPLLYQMLEDYLTVYLPKQRCASEHTISAEKTALNMFLDHLCSKSNCTYFEISLEMFNYDNMSGFLDNLVNNLGRKASTRNQRLACLRSFVDYIATRKPEFISKKIELGKIPVMSKRSDDTVKNISENGVRAILAKPNPKVKTELRDQFIMILLFDSAARASELLNLRVCDVVLGRTPVLRLFGKGSKTRIIPLMDETVAHFQNYMRVFHAEETDRSKEYLFYTVSHGERHRMSSDNLARLISKYSSLAEQSCFDVPQSVHPHMFRHSRAVILYHNGMGLPEISRFLGHANVETTIRFYARLGVEDIRQVMIKANAGGTSRDVLTTPYRVTDEETLKRLVGLK
jgi:Site-specific recombinase XerD